jgi:anaerobic magnesium-protoporphyrin IX monomethyl ester cyclase
VRIVYIQKDPFVNMGQTALAGYCKERGHESDLLIENAERDLMRSLRRLDPDVVGFSVTTGLHLWALATAAKIKLHFPGVVTVFGGMHATFFPEMVEGSAVDVVCRGEGEEALGELLDALQAGEDYTGIQNLWVKAADGTIHRNPMRPLEQDLDQYPFPDRSIYDKYPFVKNQKIEGFITGRGCPDNCSFCFHVGLKKIMSGLGEYTRRKSVEYVISEIEHFLARYPLRRLVFRDDTFVVGYEDYVKPLMAEYRKRIGIPFSCLIRADYMSEACIRDLAESGCFAVKMGVESGNEFMRNKIMQKQLSNGDIVETMRLLHKYGIMVQTSSILGAPGETLDSAWETLEFNSKLKPEHAWCSLIQPYPGTTMQEMVMREGMLPPGFDPDEFEQSYFMATPIDIENKAEISNLQKLFPLGVRFPWLQPVIKEAIKLPPNRMYNFLFKAHYAWSIMRINDMEVLDFLRIGLYTKNYFRQNF